MQKCSNRSPKHTACRARQRRRRQKKQESWRLCWRMPALFQWKLWKNAAKQSTWS
jgi:Formiminotransferase-cyclodeaminase